MNIVLLGGNGQVGWELQRALAPVGTVHAPAHRQVDLCNRAQLEEYLTSTTPDVLVNAAAFTDVDGAETETELAATINRDAVAVMASFMADRGLLVHYSTDYVFDGKKTGAYSEEDQTNPLSAYGKSKRDGETAIIVAGGAHVILRTSWIHTARGKNFVRTMLRLAAEKTELRVIGDQFGAPTSAELVADITALLLHQNQGRPEQSGIFHLTAAGQTNWHEYACFVLSEALAAGADLTCDPNQVQMISSGDYPARALRPANSMLETAKIKRTFRVELPDWRLHVRRTVQELLENR